jgi:hypothetical protein
LDLILSPIDQGSIGSLVDAKLLVNSQIWQWIEKTSAVVLTGLVERLAAKCYLYSSRTPIPEDAKLAKLINKVKLNKSDTGPIIVLNHKVNEEKETIKLVTLRVPAINIESDDQVLGLSNLINFCATILQVKAENIELCADKTLGDSLDIPKPIQKLVADLTASARDPRGSFAGPIFQSSSGFKGNLVAILAAVKLLFEKSEFIRKRPARSKGEKVVVDNTTSLLKLFNTQAGLDVSNKGYCFLFVKTVLAMCVKPLHTNFPGGWMKACKDINGVKSHEGLLVKLGYSLKVADSHKLKNVIFTDAPQIGDSPNAMRPFNDKEDSLTYIEFRAVVALILPKLDSTSKANFDEQLKVDPLKVRSKHTLDAYKAKREKCVDALNIANAYKISIDSPRKSKTKPVHYEAARNHVLKLSHDIPLIDARGQEYSTFNDIPESVRKYLRKSYFYPERDRKRSAKDAESADEMETDNAPTSKKSKKNDASTDKTAADGVSLSQNEQGPKVKRGHGVRRAPGALTKKPSKK